MPKSKSAAKSSLKTKQTGLLTPPRTKQIKLPIARLLELLADEYPAVECALNHRNPFELLIATILSAQCTDARVNIVTKVLFAHCPTPQKMAQTPVETLEKIVQSTGFFRNKAKNIQACAAALWKEHNSEVPRDLTLLVALPGVGRKTANVLLGTAYGIPSGVVVDTHVGRLSRRLGLTKATDPVQVERDLMRQLPAHEWIQFSHRLIHHGRQVCKARKPACEGCPLAEVCPQVGVS